MARLVAAFGTSHSTMLLSSLENWVRGFDHVDAKAPVYDLAGTPRPFDELVAARPADAAERIRPEAAARRFDETHAAMARLTADITRARLDVLVIVGDDQRELFKDNSRPAIGVYCGASIRNAAAPARLPEDWYYRDQTRRLEDGADVHYPCHRLLGEHLAEGLTRRDFDITAVRALTGEQFEGHAYSFIHRQYLRGAVVPVVPIFLNTYYPPNVPSPRRCVALGKAIRAALEEFSEDLRVGILASGGLSHFLVNEDLDRTVIDALQRADLGELAALPPRLLQSGSSEIRNWVCLMGALDGLKLEWLTYVPSYRSQALTGVGLCFASWR
jgi:hypothetical protein